MTNQEIHVGDQISLRELRRTGSVHGPRHKETVLALVEAVEAAQAWYVAELTDDGLTDDYRLRDALARFKDSGETT